MNAGKTWDCEFGKNQCGKYGRPPQQWAMEKPAETPLGRWATMFFGLASIAFLGTGISAAFDVKAYLRDRRRYGLMSNPVKAGYVVFNFPGADVFRLFAQEIRSVEKNIGICVVDGRL